MDDDNFWLEEGEMGNHQPDLDQSLLTHRFGTGILHAFGCFSMGNVLPRNLT